MLEIYSDCRLPDVLIQDEALALRLLVQHEPTLVLTLPLDPILERTHGLQAARRTVEHCEGVLELTVHIQCQKYALYFREEALGQLGHEFGEITNFSFLFIFRLQNDHFFCLEIAVTRGIADDRLTILLQLEG